MPEKLIHLSIRDQNYLETRSKNFSYSFDDADRPKADEVLNKLQKVDRRFIFQVGEKLIEDDVSGFISDRNQMLESVEQNLFANGHSLVAEFQTNPLDDDFSDYHEYWGAVAYVANRRKNDLYPRINWYYDESEYQLHAVLTHRGFGVLDSLGKYTSTKSTRSLFEKMRVVDQVRIDDESNPWDMFEFTLKPGEKDVLQMKQISSRIDPKRRTTYEAREARMQLLSQGLYQNGFRRVEECISLRPEITQRFYFPER